MKNLKKVFSVALSLAMAGNISAVSVLADEQGTSTQADQAQSDVVYAMVNVPYSEFYSGMATAVDVVSSATNRKAGNCSNVYFGETPKYEEGKDLKGIVFPVQMSKAAYETLKEKAQSSEEDYYVGEVLTEVPSVYRALSYATPGDVNEDGELDLTDAQLVLQYYLGGELSDMSKKLADVDESGDADLTDVQRILQYYLNPEEQPAPKTILAEVTGEAETVDDVEAEIISNTVWGDYQINLLDSADGVSSSAVYAAYLTDSEGNEYPMLQSANLWTPSVYYEFAWFVTEGAKDRHDAEQNVYKELEGKTVTGITYVTTNGVKKLNLKEGLYVAPQYKGEVSAALSADEKSVTLTGLPADISDATASVYYSVPRTKGHGSDNYYAAQDAQIVDGVITLTEDLVADQEYYVSVDSKNYAHIVAENTFRAAGGNFVLMNIPFEQFYAAEGVSSVDAVSSATKAKTMTGRLAGGSYHVNSDGTDITGITYPVKLTKNQFDKLKASDYTEVTSGSVYTATVTNRGQTSTDEYVSSAALFGFGGSYAYYILDEEPDNYKVLTGTTEDGYTFGKVKGDVTEVTDADFEVTTDTTYGDYQVNIDTDVLSGASVYGIVVTTKDGKSYGLRHVENIWQRTKLAWSTGHTTVVHGCNVSYEPYADIEGKTITKITYYSSNGNFTFPTELYLPPYYDKASDVKAAAAGTTTGSAVNISGLPEDITGASVSIYYSEPNASGRGSTTVYNTTNATLVNGAVTLSDALVDGKEYTVRIESDNYALMTVPLTK